MHKVNITLILSVLTHICTNGENSILTIRLPDNSIIQIQSFLGKIQIKISNCHPVKLAVLFRQKKLFCYQQGSKGHWAWVPNPKHQIITIDSVKFNWLKNTPGLALWLLAIRGYYYHDYSGEVPNIIIQCFVKLKFRQSEFDAWT